MNQDERLAVVGAVTMLAEALNRTASKTMIQAYEIGLDGLTAEQINRAARNALAACRFMPAPIELREMLFGRQQDRATVAWVAFERAVLAHGGYRSVNFDDRIINATIRALGGWQRCCEMPSEEFDTFLQKRFQETYCALARTGVSHEQAEPLIGWFDQQNASKGFDAQRVRHISTGLVTTSGAIEQQLPRLDLQKA